MSKQIQIAGRNVQWVKEESGPILILIVALTLIFGVKCFLSPAAPTDAPAVSQPDAP